MGGAAVAQHPWFHGFLQNAFGTEKRMGTPLWSMGTRFEEPSMIV